MRLGDWIVCVAILLNVCAGLAYAYQQHWAQAWYWFAALQINLSLLWMR